MEKYRVPEYPESEVCHDLYEVRIGSDPVPVLPVRVSAMPYNRVWPGHQRSLDQTEIAGLVLFENDGPVTLAVKPLCMEWSAQSDIRIRPLSRGVLPEMKNGEIVFTLPSSGAYTLEIDGFHRALHIFADPIREFTAEGPRKVIRYAPGIHEIGNTEIGSHTTVLIEAGAVVYGSVTAIGAEDVQVLGYGILDGSREIRTSATCILPYFPGSGKRSVLKEMILRDPQEFRDFLKKQNDLSGCLRFYACRNVRVEGVTLRDSSTFACIPAGCENVVIDRLKTIGMWRYNSDGIDVFNSRNVILSNCFVRDFDDCIVLKGIEGWDGEPNENILVTGCVVWCDWGRALEYGAETVADEYRNIVMRDCDIIHGSAVMLDIQSHNRAEIHHCLFEDIRAEYSAYQLPEIFQRQEDVGYSGVPNSWQPHLIVVMICNDDAYCSEGNAHGPVRDVEFRNIRVLLEEGAGLPLCYFEGSGGNASVSRIRVEPVFLNGQSLSYPEGKIVKVGKVSEVCFS